MSRSYEKFIETWHKRQGVKAMSRMIFSKPFNTTSDDHDRAKEFELKPLEHAIDLAALLTVLVGDKFDPCITQVESQLATMLDTLPGIRIVDNADAWVFMIVDTEIYSPFSNILRVVLDTYFS